MAARSPGTARASMARLPSGRPERSRRSRRFSSISNCPRMGFEKSATLLLFMGIRVMPVLARRAARAARGDAFGRPERALRRLPTPALAFPVLSLITRRMFPVIFSATHPPNLSKLLHKYLYKMVVSPWGWRKQRASFPVFRPKTEKNRRTGKRLAEQGMRQPTEMTLDGAGDRANPKFLAARLVSDSRYDFRLAGMRAGRG